jgi:hypothetical protein
MTDRTIIERIKSFGVDYPRLHAALDQQDNWGALVNSFVYLTVLGVVEDAMKKDHAAFIARNLRVQERRGQLNETTATQLRSARLNRGLGIHLAAHLAGITGGYLSRLERGLRRPSHRVVDQLAAALHLDPDLVSALHAEARPDFARPDFVHGQDPTTTRKELS